MPARDKNKTSLKKSAAELRDAALLPIPKKGEKICAFCGEVFTPMSYSQHGSTSRKYCYRPECERARESERRRKHRAKKKLQERD